ncbi:MAG TPA: transcription termination/antitermination NusG family protein, partial [Thermoleophilia bacterium]|nr:transcription termination/antitermination NusG family protein [Thermoleophilia bacterium]
MKANLEHRRQSMHQEERIHQIVVPTEQVVETKDGEKVTSERRVFPGYVLVQMELTDDTWSLVKNTPGVTGFVGAQNKPVALSRAEVDRIMHTASVERPKQKAEFMVGEVVRVTSG